MYGELKGNVALQYLAWVSYPIILIVFASLFCHLVAPQAIGKLLFHSCFYFLIFFVSVLYPSTLLFASLFSVTNPWGLFSLFCHLFFVLNPSQPPTMHHIFLPAFQNVIIMVSFSLAFSRLSSPQLFWYLSHVPHIRLEDIQQSFSSLIITVTGSRLCKMMFVFID